MKQQFKIFVSIGLLILYFHSSLFSNSETIKEINLEFGNIEKPPYVFIPHKQLKRPKIGLALSGGGARGFAQIGILQVLAENDIPVDFIVGTSIGSIVGGLYASGYSPHQIAEITKSIDWANIMKDKPPRTNLFIAQKQESGKAFLQLRFDGTKLSIPQAITPGQKLTSILTSLTLRADFQISSNFDQLKIPFRALACDLITGKKVLLKDGNLAEAMRSSSAVPLLFDPVARDNMMLVDGGLINNIPVNEVRDLGADLVIALDTSSKLNEKHNLNVPWKVADQVTSIMQSEKNANQRLAADVLIKPDLSDYKSDDFEFVEQLIQEGRRQALTHIKKIKDLIQKKNQNNLSQRSYFIQAIKILESDVFLKSIAEQEIKKTIKTTSSYEDIYQTMQSIYKTGYFKNVKTKCTIINDSLLKAAYSLKPNPCFSVISFEGNTIFSDSLLQVQINSKPNIPINCNDAKKDISKIIGLYKNKGYVLINISDIRLVNDTLIIHLNEGIVSSILIEGNKRTKNYVILREFPLKVGDILNINEIDKGMNNIYSSNLFKTVSFELTNVHNQANVKIKVDEKAFSIVRLGYRYDLERKNKAMIELVDENFLGLANTIAFQSQYGARDKIIKFKFRSDRIFNTFLTNNFEIYHQQIKNFIYEKGQTTGEYLRKENGLSISVGRQIERLGILSIITAVKNISLQSVSGYGYPTGNYDLKTIELRSIVDTQDKFPFPTTGKYYIFSYKLSSSTILNSQTSFFKLFSSLDFYSTFLKRNTIHPKLCWGTSDLTTPFIEQFRLGGQSSFFGLRENERIGRHIVLGSLEYRYKFPFAFPIDVYWSLKYNIGATWKNSIDIQPKDFLQGIGSSLALDTPIGPISFSLGRMSDGRNVVYFSAGFGF